MKQLPLFDPDIAYGYVPCNFDCAGCKNPVTYNQLRHTDYEREYHQTNDEYVANDSVHGFTVMIRCTKCLVQTARTSVHNYKTKSFDIKTVGVF